MERPTRCSNRPESEGIDPCGSSSAIRSMRCIGKKSVGSPMRSPSGSITCRMKSSKEFKSMPRTVTPAELIETSAPHNFSFGVCRLRMMMELGSTNVLASLHACADSVSSASNRHRFQVFGNPQFRLCNFLHGLGCNPRSDFTQHQSLGCDFDDGQFGHD